MTGNANRITVIGGGIVGASIAWHLTAAGCAVTLLSEKPGGIATPASFSWINASWGNPEPYFRLRMRSIAEWRRLADDIPGLPLTWQGSLCWDLPADRLASYRDEHSAWGYALTPLTAAEASAREPAIKAPPDVSLHAMMEGAAEPELTANLLIADARRRGMQHVANVRIETLRQGEDGSIAMTAQDGSTFSAPTLVLAAGADVPKLAADLGLIVPVETPPGLLVHSKPVGKCLNGLVIAPELHVRQTNEGRLVAGTDFGGMDPGTDPQAAASELFGKLKAFLKGGEALEMDFYTIGYRPTPADGFPILGRPEGAVGVYLAVTHSGVTLAPAIGLLAAREILSGEDEPLFAPYRLSRFG
ncbi:MAG: FAD-binding oxidoreductase [Neorhizobium sp.]|nr:FAD-binding oxidoreductase [Neorhizobium sp.]